VSEEQPPEKIFEPVKRAIEVEEEMRRRDERDMAHLRSRYGVARTVPDVIEQPGALPDPYSQKATAIGSMAKIVDVLAEQIRRAEAERQEVTLAHARLGVAVVSLLRMLDDHVADPEALDNQIAIVRELLPR
jgi:hypothetical protein